jgi:phosphoglycerate kinase
VKKPDEIAPDERIMDVGPATILDIGRRILECKFILWNGPMGNYEHGYVAQTEGLARVIAASGIYSIVGGGDTVAAIAKLNLESRLGFVSSGGGAMLEFLEKGTLPGIEALKKV